MIEKIEKQSIITACEKCGRKYKRLAYLDKHVKACEGVVTKGGARQGSGRKPGQKDAKTIEADKTKEEVDKIFKKRVIKNIEPLMNAQLSLAKGLSYLYRIDKTKKGNNKKPVLVTSPFEIALYLDDDYETDKTYYYITTDKPDSRAIDSMFDRVFGKAPQSLKLETDPDKPLVVEHALTNEERELLSKGFTKLLLKVTKD